MTDKPRGKVKARELAEECLAVAQDRKAENATIIDLHEQSLLADYFVICTAGSEPHLKAIESRIARELRDKFQVRPKSVDGKADSGWIVMDFSNVMVHILTEEMRGIYQLESLWRDAPTLGELEILAEKSGNGSL